MPMNHYIGTSGWGYREWEGTFYPEEYKNNKLKYYSRHFNAVELNYSFYRLPYEYQIEQWLSQVPKHFRFTVKASRYITHTKKLNSTAQALHQFYKSIAPFGERCHVVLFQLPPTLSIDVKKLQSFIAQLSHDYRYTFEFRNPDWYSNDVFELLEKHHIAFCVFDMGELHSPCVSTTDFLYIRLHGPQGHYHGKYSLTDLKYWGEKIKTFNKTSYIFFDNTADELAAIENAQQLTHLLIKEGG
jgi:uncharacterized protein YecE (DUF72 family)